MWIWWLPGKLREGLGLEYEWCIGGMTYSRHSVRASVAGMEGKSNCMEREKTKDRSRRALWTTVRAFLPVRRETIRSFKQRSAGTDSREANMKIGRPIRELSQNSRVLVRVAQIRVRAVKKVCCGHRWILKSLHQHLLSAYQMAGTAPSPGAGPRFGILCMDPLEFLLQNPKLYWNWNHPPKISLIAVSGHIDLLGLDSSLAQTTFCYKPRIWWLELPPLHCP